LCPPGDPSWFVDAKPAADGPDPSGRIIFGQIAREASILGQIVGPVFAIDPDGSDLVKVLDCKIQRPRVSPDGTRLAFSIAMDDGTMQVATANVDGSRLRILTSTTGFAETPDWSPDGSSLIYSHAPQQCTTGAEDDCANDRRYSLWRMDADGGNQQRITGADTLAWEPRFSPDGRAVVFQTFDFADETLRIGIRDLDTGRERFLIPTSHAPEHPDWSPDGQWIIYNLTGCPACEQVERVPSDNLDARPEVLYPSGPTQDGYKPVYAPDGSRIVFGCEGRLCVMDADGSNVEVLVSASGTFLNHFDWGSTPQT
jgi:Tol biopolymer transport system component